VDTARIELPLFPLHSVLCPGVALPLHIFEERYRLMVSRCIERSEPFGVVLIREGHEVGPLTVRVAEVGTTALIREAGRYPDGRMDIMTVGGRRFRVHGVDGDREPYLVGDVSLIEEQVGERREAQRLAALVGRRFLEYLEVLQPALAGEDGPEIEVEIEIETPDPDPDAADDEPRPAASGLRREILSAFDEPGDETPRLGAEEDPGDDPAERASARETLETLSESQRKELLMAAARRLTAPGDPTALSYVLSGLVHVELQWRQALLEAPDTVTRLRDLEQLLRRETQLLAKGLKPLIVDNRQQTLRRN
jgi:Lon protease-like protein